MKIQLASPELDYQARNSSIETILIKILYFCVIEIFLSNNWSIKLF